MRTIPVIFDGMTLGQQRRALALDKAYDKGRNAYCTGKPQSANPYALRSAFWQEWDGAWRYAASLWQPEEERKP